MRFDVWMFVGDKINFPNLKRTRAEELRGIQLRRTLKSFEK